MKRLALLLLAIQFLLTANAQNKKYYGDGADNVLRLIPCAAVVTLKLCNVDSESSWQRLTVSGGSSIALTAVSTWALKSIIHDTRPDGSDNHAFPSGHTAIAFVGARILDKEYRHVSPWISVAGYSVATITAIDRISRNRHRLDDVAIGAAIGIGATELGYWLGDKLIGKHTKYALSVSGNQLYFAMQF